VFRETNLDRLRSGTPFDVLVIGGGVNGAATFRDLSLNGVSTLLVDRRDFCAGASSASSRMAHGGLRYLEGREFRLVRESTRERNRLLLHAPHLVRPLGIVVPLETVVRGFGGSMARFLGVSRRPAALSLATMTSALAVYEAMGRAGRALPAFSLSLRPERTMPGLRRGTAALARYHDGLIESPEGLILEMIVEGVEANPASAALNHVAWEAEGGAFRVADEASGAKALVSPKVVVNAAGSAIDGVNRRLGLETALVRPVKGAHLVIRHAALTERLGGDAVYFDDGRGRMVIMVPLGETVLMGTTEIDVAGDEPVTAAEVEYLVAAASALFDDVTVSASDVVAVTVGNRPLQAGKGDANAARRDHLVARHALPGAADVPVLSLVGGKWTTFRAFGEEAADAVLGSIQRRRTVETGERDYPGAAGFPRDRAALAERVEATAQRTGLTAARARALWDRYGAVAEAVADHCAAGKDAPLAAFPDHSRREIGWLCTRRAAVRLDDLVLRRTNLVLTGRMTRDALDELAGAMADALGRDEAWANGEAERCAAMPTILFRPGELREMAA